MATKDRDNTSFLIRSSKGLLLIDCPGSIIQKLKKCSVDPKKLDGILLTHTHPDHIYGLPSLVHSLMLEDCRIPVYGSRESVDFGAALLDLFGLREKKFRCRLDFVAVEEGESVRLSSRVSCSFFRVPHSASSMALCFHLEGGKRVLYSGDTPVYLPLFRRVRNIDHLVHDCSAPSRFFTAYPELKAMHTDSLTLGKVAQENRVKHLVPVHFFGEVAFSLSEIEEEIRQHFTGPLTIPKDFSVVDLSET